MSRPNSTSPFEEEPSADSGIGIWPSSRSVSPLNESELARAASYFHQGESGERDLRRIQSEHLPTRRLQTESPDKGPPHNGVHFAGQVALPTSRPASTPFLNSNVNTKDSSVPARPQTPYPFQHKTNTDESSDMGDAEAVLPAKRRETPTPVNAPRLQWDLAKPLLEMTSQSKGTEEKEDTEAEQRSIEETKGEVARAGTPFPSLVSAIENGQHHKANALTPPSSHRIYTVERPSSPTPEQQPSSQIPSLLRVLDANLQPQPHHLSPLAERDEQSDHTQSRSQLSPAHSLPSSSSPPSTPRCCQTCVEEGDDDDEPRHSIPSCHVQDRVSRPRTNTQRTCETDPYLFSTTEMPGLQTAQLLPVQCIARADVRCGEVTIPHRCSRGGVEVGEGCEGLVRRRSGRAGKKGFGARVSKAWTRIKGLLCRSRKI